MHPQRCLQISANGIAEKIPPHNLPIRLDSMDSTVLAVF
jgi:hypothetical protein